MKTLKTIALISIVSAGMISSVFAVQGTCSYHGGVDCKSEYDWDGSVLCNDGWKDSSEMFYDTKLCTASLHYCSTQSYNTILNKYNIDEQTRKISSLTSQLIPSSNLQQTYTSNAQMIGGYTQSALNSGSADVLRANAITNLNLASEIIPLQSKLKQDLFNITRECYAVGEKEYTQMVLDVYKKTLNPCEENAQLSNGSCGCKAGYVMSNGTCIDNSLNCMNQYGKSSYYDNGSCQCSPGYKMNFKKTKCVSPSEQFCQPNASLVDGKCSCNSWFISDGQNNCVSLNAYCQIVLKTTQASDGQSCVCSQGQTFNRSTNVCEISASSSKSNTNNSSFKRTLKKGMVGQDVKSLQTLLVKINYLPKDRTLTTSFDDATNKALIKFQNDNKIQPATGSFGPATQAMLIKLSK